MSKQQQRVFALPSDSAKDSLFFTTSPDVGLVFIVLYLLLHFIPNWGSVDVIGPQWLAVSLLNVLVTGFLLVRRVSYAAAVNSLFRLALPIVYLLLVFWAAGSYFYAINKGEVLVNLARLLNTAVVFLISRSYFGTGLLILSLRPTP